ncbi:MAG: adenylate/guanylate cyclase domain-containing protein [Geminicoccaceae bacterium]
MADGRRLTAASVVARVRLWSGLCLFLYAALHLANHALGLVSLPAMEAGRRVFLGFWRFPPVEALLALSLVLHPLAALHGLWRRGTLRMSAPVAFQFVSGFLIPIFLVGHVVVTGIVSRCCGVVDTYAYFLNQAWPGRALSLLAMLTLVWFHGCLGLHLYFRIRRGYARWAPWLLAGAVLLPTLALVGVLTAGRDVAALRLDPAWVASLAAAGERQPPEVQAWSAGVERHVLLVLAALLLLVLAARAVRWLLQQRSVVRITYPDGRRVVVPRGFSVLEASRKGGVPHAAVCGGRGRCSTCRVRVGAGAGHLPRPEPPESRLLARIGAPEDMRLACQLRPTADLAVTPLLPADTTAAGAGGAANPAAGVERELAVMFADLRGFTKLSEGRLPYDTVFILNRYFRAMGIAIETAGGRVDKFIGDGIMAWFGLDVGPAEGARQALVAARAMGEALSALNVDLDHDLRAPLRMGIGLHLGPAIVGEMGFGGTASLTAIGDTVNVASRLESLTKEHEAELVVSQALVDRAGLDLAEAPVREVEIRGRTGRLAVRVLQRTSGLATAVA